MSDWLSEDDGSYLGLDDPPMPDAPPAAPTQAPATNDGGWMDQGGQAAGNDGWFDTGTAGQSQGAPVADTQGDWLANEEPQAWTAQPAAASAPPAQDPYAAHANPVQQQQYASPPPQHHDQQGGLMVGAPVLENVLPSPTAIGTTRGELSNLVLDVEVQVEVGLGNSVLTVEEFLEMGRGSVVELDTPVDAPIELKVRGKLVARGQLVSINGSYGMRILEMLGEEH